MTMGIKEGVADVEVKTVDLGSEVVTTAKIADGNVTNVKMNVDAGRWASGSFISGTTTWTGTAAFTVLVGLIKVTAAAAGVVSMGHTADADSIFKCTSTVAAAYGNIGVCLALDGAVQFATAQNTTISDFSAGASVLISAAASVAGKYYFLYIATAV